MSLPALPPETFHIFVRLPNDQQVLVTVYDDDEPRAEYRRNRYVGWEDTECVRRRYRSV